MVTGNSPTQQPEHPWVQGRLSRRKAFTRSNHRAVLSNSVEGGRSIPGRLTFIRDRQVHNQFAFGGVEALLIDLNDSVALLLIELKDPPIEIITLISHIVLRHTCRQDKSTTSHIFNRELRFDIRVNGEKVQKKLFLLVEDISIAAAITDAKEVDGLTLSMVAQSHLNPRPFLQ